MGRIRTLKPEFTTDEELSALPAETHLFAAGLLCYADDEGYFNAHPGLLKAAIFPLRECSVSTHDMLKQLVGTGYLRLGTTPDGKHWGQVVKFAIHQRVNRPTPSKIKELDVDWSNSVSPHGVLNEPSLEEGKGKEVGTERERVLIEDGIPDWIPTVSWNAFVEMRKKIKKPLTDHGKNLCVKKLSVLRDSGYEPEVILDAAVMNDWQGLFVPKGPDGQPIKPSRRKYRQGDPNNPADWLAAQIPEGDE